MGKCWKIITSFLSISITEFQFVLLKWLKLYAFLFVIVILTIVLTWCFLKNISIVFVCYWFFTWFFIIAARNIHKSIFIYIFKMFLNLLLILNLTQMLLKWGFFAWIMPIFRVFVLKKFPFASWFMFKKMLKSFKKKLSLAIFLQFSTTILTKPHPFFFYYWNHQRLLNLFIFMTNLCFCEYIMKKFS